MSHVYKEPVRWEAEMLQRSAKNDKWYDKNKTVHLACRPVQSKHWLVEWCEDARTHHSAVWQSVVSHRHQAAGSSSHQNNVHCPVTPLPYLQQIGPAHAYSITMSLIRNNSTRLNNDQNDIRPSSCSESAATDSCKVFLKWLWFTSLLNWNETLEKLTVC